MNKLDRAYVFRMAEKVMIQAQCGVVYIGSWKYCVKFDLNKMYYQGRVLDLGNTEFLDQVKNYLSQAREFYIKDKDYYELDDMSFDEKLFMDLFVNMTNFDIENIDVYLSQRTKMLLDKNNYTAEPIIIGTLKHAGIEISILKNTSNLEAPLRFRTILRDGEERFLLPDITFGVIDDCLHVYAVQRKRDEQTSKTAKIFDRYFRKFNKGVDMNDEITSQISTNALAAVTIFFGYFKNQNINKVKAFGFMPLRYNAKVETAARKLKDEHEFEEFLEENDRNQFNITNKFFNTMFRYAYHFNQQAEYDECYECLDMELEENKVDINVLNDKERNIIYDLDELVSNGLSVDKQI